MGSRKIIMLIGSILIGALAGFALLNYVRGVENQAVIDSNPVKVWVVAQDIPAGTTAIDVLQTGRLVERDIDPDFRPATAIAATEQIEGRVAVSNLAANQILVQGMFDDPEVVETTFSDLIADDHVAISLQLDQVRMVNGFVEPGDFVDIIAIAPLPATPPELGDDALEFDVTESPDPYDRVARFMYRGVRVIAVGSDIVGEGVDDAVTNDEGEFEAIISIAVPSESAQRILSVEEEDLVLALLPDGWEPVAQPDVVTDDIATNADLPGEVGSVRTPYGPDGYLDPFEQAVDQQRSADGEG